MRVSICNEVYRDWPIEQALAHARRTGYEGVEIAPHTLGEGMTRFAPATVARLRRAARDNGLEIVGLHWLLAGTQGVYLTTPDPVVRRATVEYLSSLAALCAELGGRVMVLGSPRQRNLLPGMDEAQATAAAAETIAAVLPRLESLGVVLALEPLAPEETNFLNTADQAAALADSFHSPCVRLNLDVKAMSSESTPIPDLVRRHRHRLAHFHANDPNRRGPGMGRVDFVPILGVLREIGYAGWVSVEVFDESLPSETLVEQSLANLRRDLERTPAA